MPIIIAAVLGVVVVAGVVLLAIEAVIGNNTIGNGISTAAVSMGTLWMFSMMLGTFRTKH